MEPSSTPTRKRTRILRTGLTLSTVRAAAKDGDLSDNDADLEDRQLLAATRADNAKPEDKENETGDEAPTPGKDLYTFQKKQTKKFGMHLYGAGLRTNDQESEDETPTTPDTPTRRGRGGNAAGHLEAGRKTPKSQGRSRTVGQDQARSPSKRGASLAAKTAGQLTPTSRKRRAGGDPEIEILSKQRKLHLGSPSRGRASVEVGGETGNETLPVVSTPTRRSNRLAGIVQAETPEVDRCLRRRKAARHLATVVDAPSSEEEDEIDEEEEEDDEEEEEGAGMDAGREGRKEREDDEEEGEEEEEDTDGFLLPASYERYFADLHSSNAVTSNNTLSKLPTLQHNEFVAALAKAPKKHASCIARLNKLYREHFPQWYFELSCGFNLLFYGYGSKRELLTNFATTMLADSPLLIVNGYHPTATIKDVLGKIIDGVLGHTGPLGSIQDQVALISAYFSEPEREVSDLFLLIHNIDGASLRSDKTQTALASLASSANIHVIASVDHINAPMLWDNVKSARFGWAWHDLTTFEGYAVETTFEDSLMAGTRELGQRGVMSVLNSLNTNARNIFRILAEHQIASAEAEPSGGTKSKKRGGGAGGNGMAELGLPYNMYYAKADENFLVSNELTFKTQLTEFRDHKIIQSKRASDGSEVLYIPLDAETLGQILESL
ncbi:Origin recognition complex subunit 2 [Borealophlyctis nickersoniae]|nr:Origin recognition complex subunit 2 [Borealophlyctis nickersoniae]